MRRHPIIGCRPVNESFLEVEHGTAKAPRLVFEF
jgi:hypothetical protein